MKSTIGLAVAVMLLSASSEARCICTCVNGTVKAICTNTIEIPPICVSHVCPIVTPSVRPIERPRIAPLGTTSCRNQQVFNQQTRRYEWRQLCR